MRPAFALALGNLPLRGARIARHASARNPARQAAPQIQRAYGAQHPRQLFSTPRACAKTSTPVPVGTPQQSSPSASPAGTPAPENADRPLRLLWDSDCPLCVTEVNGLKRRAAAFATSPVEFVDVASLDYSPSEENGGVSYETAMGRIHAVMGNGTVISGVEVFRRVYEALGMGWVYAPTKVPVIGAVVERAYDIWAVNRLWVTGRPTLDEIVKMREKARETRARGDGTCR